MGWDSELTCPPLSQRLRLNREFQPHLIIRSFNSKLVDAEWSMPVSTIRVLFFSSKYSDTIFNNLDWAMSETVKLLDTSRLVGMGGERERATPLQDWSI